MLNMKTAKSFKLILLISAFALSLIMAFTTMGFGVVNASSSAQPTNYFDYGKGTTATFDSDNAVFTLTEADTIKIKKEVAVNDFIANLKLGEGVESVEVIISTDSYFVNGNKNADGKYDTTVKNSIKVEKGNIETARKVAMKVDESGYYVKSVDGNAETVENNAYYRVPTSNDYNVLIGSVEFKVELKENATSAKFEIVSLSQKGSDDTYLQTFVLADGKLTDAKPVISFANEIKVIDDNGTDKLVMYDESSTKINYTIHSFLGDKLKSNTKITVENGWVNESNNGEVHFDKSVTEFKIVDKDDATKVFCTASVKVLDHTAEYEVKPVYTKNDDAINAFKSALEKEYTVVYNNGTPDNESDDTKRFVALGTTIDIPSLKDLVSDDYTSYESLTHTVYYSTPAASDFATKTDMKLTLSTAGNYMFFVVFTDNDGNGMEKSDFILEEEGKEDQLNFSADGYGAFVFSFYVADDAPITITPAAVQGKGYIGTSYTASKFTVDATGCTITYKLYYNADLKAEKGSDGWVEIPKASDITDTNYNENGYSYDDIKAIAYNGSLTFTPDKVGSYKIECIANSKTTAREATESTVIRIENKPIVVKPASEWLQNNVWSVVFLSIGTLCLIGIIVLLCIKPKEENKD